MNDSETIRTMSKNSAPGVLMLKEQYSAIKTFLLDILEKEKVVSSIELINRCHEKFYPMFQESTGLLVYNVKADLEAQGIIFLNMPDKRRGRPTVSTVKAKPIRYYRN
jgi:hypothetical protein